jgi:phytoene dehydrogenase-like protein
VPASIRFRYNGRVTRPVIVIGGGLSGLACAITLQANSIPYQILEAEDRVGGRLKTDSVQGFSLDRGFQVYLPAYPNSSGLLDHDALDLRPFPSGARLFDWDKQYLVDQAKPLRTLLDTAFGLPDKLRVIALALWASQRDSREFVSLEQMTAQDFLVRRGFSRRFMDSFARPFFGGIFLDRSLSVSASQLMFVFKMLGKGGTAIPAKGIEEIPRQLLRKLVPGAVRTFSRAEALKASATSGTPKVRTTSGDEIEALAVVLAMDSSTQEQFLACSSDNDALATTSWRSSTCLYFSSTRPIFPDKYIGLNCRKGELVNEVVPISNVSPDLVPLGGHLTSVTLLGHHDTDDQELARNVTAELSPWFNGRTLDWNLLKVYRIPRAQLVQAPGFREHRPTTDTSIPGVFRTGEGLTNSSIDGAIEAGVKTGLRVVGYLRK